MNIYNTCFICIKESKKLLWFNGIPLCKECYEEYKHSDNYDKRNMLINSITKHRKIVYDMEMKKCK